MKTFVLKFLHHATSKLVGAAGCDILHAPTITGTIKPSLGELKLLHPEVVSCDKQARRRCRMRHSARAYNHGNHKTLFWKGGGLVRRSRYLTGNLFCSFERRNNGGVKAVHNQGSGAIAHDKSTDINSQTIQKIKITKKKSIKLNK